MATHHKTETKACSAGVPIEPRHWVAAWASNILIFLFGTTTVLQAFVVPTGSMEGTMLIGDHIFVDRLSYSPQGSLSKHLLPYQEVKRGDIIVFKYPLDIRQNYVKRVIGIPGDRIRISDKVVHLNGRPLHEPYKVVIPQQTSTYLNSFPRIPDILIERRGLDMLRNHVVDGELVVPNGHTSRWVTTATIRRTAGSGALCRARTSSVNLRWSGGRALG